MSCYNNTWCRSTDELLSCRVGYGQRPCRRHGMGISQLCGEQPHGGHHQHTALHVTSAASPRRLVVVRVGIARRISLRRSRPSVDLLSLLSLHSLSTLSVVSIPLSVIVIARGVAAICCAHPHVSPHPHTRRKPIVADLSNTLLLCRPFGCLFVCLNVFAALMGTTTAPVPVLSFRCRVRSICCSPSPS